MQPKSHKAIQEIKQDIEYLKASLERLKNSIRSDSHQRTVGLKEEGLVRLQLKLTTELIELLEIRKDI